MDLQPQPKLLDLVPLNLQTRLNQSDKLCEILGYQFKNTDLLIEALTHSSAAKELARQNEDRPSLPWNERLEFIGDSVLGLVLSTNLLNRPDNFREGELSKIRAALVNEKSLASISRSIELGSYLLLSTGEERSSGRHKDSILADALEAIIGAIYQDGGFQEAKAVILGLYDKQLQGALGELIQEDYKSRLQELTQRRFKETPEYQVIDCTGPDHSQQFWVEVKFRQQVLATGKGRNKKKASQQAAKIAVGLIERSPDLLTQGIN